jgi:hypothetical protein
MTLETYYMIDLTDIGSVELKCKTCGLAEIFPLATWKSGAPYGCRNCHGQWLVPTGVSGEALGYLTKALERLIADENGRGCSVRLQIKGIPPSR